MRFLSDIYSQLYVIEYRESKNPVTKTKFESSEFCFLCSLRFDKQDCMRRVYLSLVTIGIGLFIATSAVSDEFKFSNGNVLRGDFASANEDGLVVKLDVGGFSERAHWIDFEQDTLKMLLNIPEARPYVTKYIIRDPKLVRKPLPPIVLRPVDRPKHTTEETGFFAALMNPFGFFLIGILLLVNLFAAYEIARFRRWPVLLVCGTSFVMPIIAPIVFLSFPPPHEPEEEEEEEETQALEVPQKAAPAGGRPGLSLSSQGESSGGGLPHQWS
jgi:hypothetical protein